MAFKKGQSGNPKGKPPGSKNRATVLLESVSDADWQAILKKTVAKAKEGDATCLKLLFDRRWPIRRGRPVLIDLPPVETVADVLRVQGVIIGAMGRGELTPEEAEVMTGVVDAKRKAIETLELEKRIAAIEAAQEKNP